MAAKKKKAAVKAAAKDTATALLEVSSKSAAKADTIVKVLPRDAIKVVKGFNPREVVGDVTDLSANIKKNGLLQYPVVRPTNKAGEYALVAGERRMKAIDKLGWKEIPCTIRTDLQGEDDKARAASIAENSEDGRCNLNAIEMGRVFLDLQKKDWTVASIASASGVSIKKARRCLSLIEAPKDVLKKVQAGELSVSAGLELAKLDDKTRAKIKDSLSVNAGRNEIKKAAKAAAKAAGAAEIDGKKVQQKTGAARDAALVAWRGSKAKQAKLAELCHYLETAEKDEVGTIDYHELRGAIGMLLWDRGDIDDPILPSLEPDEDDEKKQLKFLLAVIKAEAAKFTPPPAEEE